MNRREMNDSPGPGPGRRWARLRRAGLAAVLALIGLLATACGGGSSPAASAGGGSTHVQAALAYARCMRAHGVPDFPDPDSNGQFNVDPHSTSSQETAADHACHHLLNAGAQMEPRQEIPQLVKYAQCMRAHGVPNFPDPHYTSGGIGRPGGMLGFGGGPGLDLKHPSPQVQSANHACQHLLPGGGRSHE
jgi:hypothetical protein